MFMCGKKNRLTFLIARLMGNPVCAKRTINNSKETDQTKPKLAHFVWSGKQQLK